MPDLLASTSLLPLAPAIPARAPVAAPLTADFMAMLGEVVLAPGSKPQGGKGHGLAGDGKILPGEGRIADAEDEEADPLIAWLPAGLVPLQPIEPAPLPVAAVAMLPAGDAVIPSAVPDVVTLPVTTNQPAVEAVPIGPAMIDGEVAPVEMPTPEADPQIDIEAPVRLPRPMLAPINAPQLVVPGAAATATAAQVFAAAISASFDSPLAPASRAGDPVIVQAQTAAEQLRTTVQAMSGADQPPLDMSRDDWAGKMVDRIAVLRDAAEAADTRIRLAPENLGNVEVSIRREGDRIHVHFAAENPAARQLLAEAAPRLAELADARGVKLGQTSVDAGTGGQQGSPGRPQPNRSARPASTAAHADHDDRIA
jgi:flagellar hook-length control protein FliK